MQITVYVSRSSAEMLEGLANHLGRSRSNTIRWLITQEYRRHRLDTLVPQSDKIVEKAGFTSEQVSA